LEPNGGPGTRAQPTSGSGAGGLLATGSAILIVVIVVFGEEYLEKTSGAAGLFKAIVKTR